MAHPEDNRNVISEEYREMQSKLHSNSDFGVESRKYGGIVGEIIKEIGASEILDYGSGKGRLAESIDINIPIREYDPAIKGKDTSPDPCHFVVCIDVLEHIEPDLLDNVLDDLKRVVTGVGFFTVCSKKALRILSDGRNAHLIQEDMCWWLPKLMDRFDIHSLARTKKGFWVICHVHNNSR